MFNIFCEEEYLLGKCKDMGIIPVSSYGLIGSTVDVHFTPNPGPE